MLTLNLFENKHMVYSIPRGGYYLIDTSSIIENTTEENPNTNNRAVNFINVWPENKVIPHKEFIHVMDHSIETCSKDIYSYEKTGGYPLLKQILSDSWKGEGLFFKQDDVIITNGSQQGLSLVFKTLFEKSNKKLLIEEPTYGSAITLALDYGIQIETIKRNENGINLIQLEEKFKTYRYKAFYIIPRHHNPTGTSLSEKEKCNIVNLANQYNVILIEDDYLGPVASDEGFMPLHFYDTLKSTIYIRSFSKNFMPGIRIGVIISPKYLQKDLLRNKINHDLGTSPLIQSALALYIQSGLYDRHIKKLRNHYDKKIKIAKLIVEELWIGKKPYIPKHGFFIWLPIPENVNITNLIDELKIRNIEVIGDDACYLNEQKLHHLKISLCSVDYKDISKLSEIIILINKFQEQLINI